MEIYITEEGKAELKAKIAILQDLIPNAKTNSCLNQCVGGISAYEQILSSAIVVPIAYDYSGTEQKDYPNGVIIKPNQTETQTLTENKI